MPGRMFSHTAIQAKSKHKALTYLHYITTEVALIEYLEPSIIIGICGPFTIEVTNLRPQCKLYKNFKFNPGCHYPVESSITSSKL